MLDAPTAFRRRATDYHMLGSPPVLLASLAPKARPRRFYWRDWFDLSKLQRAYGLSRFTADLVDVLQGLLTSFRSRPRSTQPTA
jgi:hypothetical protein